MKKLIGTMTKRGFAFSLALVMCISMLPTVSLAAEESEGSTPEPEITLVSVPDSPQPETLSENSTVGGGDPVDVTKEDSDTEADEDSDEANITEEGGGTKADENGDDASAEKDGDAPSASNEGDGANAGENGDAPGTLNEGDDPDAENPSQDDDTWDITQTQRPEASETVEHSIGTDVDKVTFPEGEDKPWDIFYNPDEDVYKVTFNIGAEAEGTQTIDLTKALELMNKYAETGKQKLQEAIDKVEKPEMGETPPEPGKPEGLDDKTTAAFEAFTEMAAADPTASTTDNAKTCLSAQGLDVSDKFVQDYAEYMVNSTNLKQAVAEYEAGNVPPWWADDLDACLFYCFLSEEQYAKVEWTGGGCNQGDPYISVPEYLVNKDSDEYKAYEAAKAEIEEKYANDKAAYDAALQELQAEFDRRVEANILEPGDVKKFELYLTSDSQHTYKYLSGSFTLATPEWLVGQVDPEKDDVIGFDGQVLPEEYVDDATYHVTMCCAPIQSLLETLYIQYPDVINRSQAFYDDNNNIIDYPYYWEPMIKEVLGTYSGSTPAEQLNSYILSYYEKAYHTEYGTIDELIQNNVDACAELTKTGTSGNEWFYLDNISFEVTAHTDTVKYDTFYKNLFSFAFGSEADIDKLLGEATFNQGTNRWEYANDSWTDNGYQQALYYYMDHQEIWEKTDAYFNTLLEGGLSNEQATWTSLMMALNIDGELTGNLWQDTKWPWYSSIQLEQMDIDFSLSKKDQATGETITSGETEFQVYYIDKVKGEDGTETSVNMYCTYDAENNAYTFVTTPSTVWTQDGELNISYAMMKDVVYYLQEQTAPEGYQKDTNVYIVMSEGDYDQLTDEDKASLGEFDEFLDMTVSEDGLKVNADFINVKIVKPDPKPSHDPDPDPGPDIEIPEEGPPLTDIPEEDPPLADIPEEDPPLAEIPEEDPPLAEAPGKQPSPVKPSSEKSLLVEISDEDVPLADVPKTGDLSLGWYSAFLLSACGLTALVLLKKRERNA